MPRSVTVAVCTFQRYGLLQGAIASVLPQVDGRSTRLLVVDNSPDGEEAAAFARSYVGDASIQFLHEPLPGVSAARNMALSACDSQEIIAFLDDDALALPGWVDAIRNGFREGGDRAAVVGGPVEPGWPRERPRWLHDEALTYLSLVDLGPKRRALAEREWLAGTNMAFRAGTLAAAGGFDRRLGRIGTRGLLSNEDIEAQRRLGASGWTRLYEPSAKVRHLIDPARLTQGWFRQRVAWQAISNHLVDPRRIAADAERAANGITNFLRALPVSGRSLSALSRDVDDPALFRLQLRATYLLQARLLTGEGPPEL